MKAYNLELKKTKSTLEKIKICGSQSANGFCRQFFSDDLGVYESCFLIILNRANESIAWVKISQGGLVGTVVDPILVAKYAIDSLAKSVILCHNHPSGNLTPSVQDDAITAKIKAGLALFDVALLDHLIITEEKYYSYADEGKI